MASNQPEHLAGNSGARATRIVLASVLALAVLILAACIQENTVQVECEDGGEHWTEYRLFLGRSANGVEVVSDDEWVAFLADTVTPRFPAGLSVIDVAGQWQTDEGIVERERTKMLWVLAPPGTEALDLMNEVSSEYKRQFSQDAVLRVITQACVAFK